MVRKLLTIIILLLLIGGALIAWKMLGNKVEDLVDLRTEVQKAVVQESEEDIERIAAFVTHGVCVSNNNACAGSVAEWLATCAFRGSQRFTGVSNKVNFRQAYTYAPWIDRKPYKLNYPDRLPYYKLRLSGIIEKNVAKSILDHIKDSGHFKTYKRIKETVVLPFLEYGTKAKGFPDRFADICGQVVKMGRSQLGKLQGAFTRGGRGWPSNAKVQADMRTAGFVEIEAARITDASAQADTRPGRVYGDSFVFYKRP